MGALDVAESLGRGTPGDDYRRLVPLMDAVPAWIHGLWVMAGILYLVAIAGVFRRARGAFVVLLVAVGLEVVAQLTVRPIAAATGVVVNPRGLVDVVRFILPLALALVLWQDSRHPTPSVSTSN